MSKLSKVLIILIVTGCSNKAVYDNIRINQRNECLKEPPPTYLECMERTQNTYEEYERGRKEILEKTTADEKKK